MEKEKKVVPEGKVWALMSYLWILCLIPLIMKRDDKFILFHAKQGLMLFLGSIIFSAVALIPIIGLIGALANLIIFILSIAGIINSLLGRYWRIPFLGEYVTKLEI